MKNEQIIDDILFNHYNINLYSKKPIKYLIDTLVFWKNHKHCIDSKHIKKIKTIQSKIKIFEKDKNRNYFNKQGKGRLQGYNLTSQGLEFFRLFRIQKIKSLQHFEEIPLDCFVIENIDNIPIEKAIGIYKDKIIIENTKKVIEFGREYSTFSLMKSELRQYTNYKYEYDMKNSGLNFMFQLFKKIHGFNLYKEITKSNIIRSEEMQAFMEVSSYLQNPMAYRKLIEENQKYKINPKLAVLSTIYGNKELSKSFYPSKIRRLYRGIKIIADTVLYALSSGCFGDEIMQLIEHRIQRKEKYNDGTIIHFLIERLEEKVYASIEKYLSTKNIKTLRVHDAFYSERKLTQQELNTALYFVEKEMGFQVTF